MIAIAKRKNPCARWEYFKASKAAGNAIRSPVNEEEGFAQSKGVSKSQSIIKRPLVLERYNNARALVKVHPSFLIIQTHVCILLVFLNFDVFFLFFLACQKGIFEHLE